jgi:hypothetical protein
MNRPKFIPIEGSSVLSGYHYDEKEEKLHVELLKGSAYSYPITKGEYELFSGCPDTGDDSKGKFYARFRNSTPGTKMEYDNE